MSRVRYLPRVPRQFGVAGRWEDCLESWVLFCLSSCPSPYLWYLFLPGTPALVFEEGPIPRCIRFFGQIEEHRIASWRVTQLDLGIGLFT